MPTRTRAIRNRLYFLLAWLCCTSAPAAELVTLSPQNYAEYAPTGREAKAFFGDYVLRNELISIAIADPTLLSGRSASRWDILNVAGTVIDLTRRDAPNDLLIAYYPAIARFKPDAPNFQHELKDEALTAVLPGREPRTGQEVTLRLPAYELGSRRALDELARLPAYLRGAPKANVEVSYTLADGWDGVVVDAVYRNPTKKAVRPDLRTTLRIVGQSEAGVDLGGRMLCVYSKWWGQAYGILAEGHTLALAKTDRRGVFLRHVSPNGEAPTIPPGGSLRVRRRLFPGPNALAVKATAARLLGRQLHPVRLELTAPDGPVASADLTVFAGEQRYGAARTDAAGKLRFELPAGRYRLRVEAFGRAPLDVELDPASQPRLRLECGAAGKAAARIRDAQGGPIPCKVALFGRDGTPDPDFFPATGERQVRNLYYSHTGAFRQVLPPGNYEAIVSHGPEYDFVRVPLQIERGKAAPLEATLKRAVKTPGWISAELHNHSTVSGASDIFYVYPYRKDPVIDGDSTASQLGRVLNLLAEHIEFAPPTEHNFISSYAPLLQTLGAEKLMATCPGIGLTAGRRHTVNHQNVFPVIHLPGKQDGGALQRPEHIQQLAWMLKWDDGAEKLVQIDQPQQDKLRVQSGMDVLNVYSLAPIVEGQPLAGVDNRILEWLEILDRGYRLPAVVNTGALDNFHGSGRMRNYIKSPTDDPAKIKPLDVVRAAERGNVVMTTGPFLRVAAAGVGPGDQIAAVDGRLTLAVEAKSSNLCTIDRVQVLVHGKRRADLDFPWAANSARTVPLELEQDGYVIVVASGSGNNLRQAGGGREMHVAVANPIYVDVGGDGYRPHSPLDDRVSCWLGFTRPILARPGAPPGRVRLKLTNNGEAPAQDVVSLTTYPGDAVRLIGPAEKSYSLAYEGAETSVEWDVAFTDEYLARVFPVSSTYNSAARFGVRVERSAKFPGRRPASHYMVVDHSVASLPPVSAVDQVALALAGQISYPLRPRRGEPLARARFAVVGDKLAVSADVVEPRIERRRVIWEGSCLEVFGSMPGRDREKNKDVYGGHFPISQIYLAPRVGRQPAAAFRRLKGKLTPAPDIAVTSRVAGKGYSLHALIRLAHLGIDVDALARHVRFAQNQVPVSLLGIPPTAGRFLLEARVTAAKGATRQKATIFGSRAPHVDHHAYGRMRLEGVVGCRLQASSPLLAEPDAAPTVVRVTLANTGKQPAHDVVSFQLSPAGVAEFVGAGEVAYKLGSGAEIVAELRVALIAGAAASSVELVALRSPRGEVAGADVLTISVAGRTLARMPPVKALADIDKALAGQRVFAVVKKDATLARMRFAVGGADLLVAASIVDRRMTQHSTPWRASCLELFGSMPGEKRVGQVFLTPAVAGAPARTYRSVKGKIEPEPSIRVQTARTASGYDLYAIIPLALLAVEAKRGELLLEAQITSAAGPGKVQRATLFGSPRAYQDNHKYGRFRLAD